MTTEDAKPRVAGERVSLGRDLLMVLLAVLSIGILVYDEAGSPAETTRQTLILIDWFLVSVFAAEFLLRLWRTPNKALFLRRNWWELPGMVPMAVGEAGFLRAFRLLRVARFLRILRAVSVLARLQRLNRLVGRFVSDSYLAQTATLASLVVVGSSFMVWYFERANPSFSSFGQTLWWAVVTVTTVGYGDVVPQTLTARIVAGFLMFVGVGLIGVLSATLAQAILRRKLARSDAHPEQQVSDLPGSLARLAQLHADGELDDEEYRRAKARVLEA